MKIKKLRAVGLVIAMVSAPGVFVLGQAAPTFAHCIGSSTGSTSDGFGRQYNLNNTTCNGDLAYTGRFEDLSTSYSIRMRWDAGQDGVFEGFSTNSSSNVADTPSGLLWSYSDSNSASYFGICETNGSGGILGCSSTGTNSGY